MSHVEAKTDEPIVDLNAAAMAAAESDMELVRDVPEFNWYQQHVGDHPIPEGFTKDSMGKCEHVIRLKGSKGEQGRDKPYEIGLARNPKGPGWVPMFDFYGGGNGLMQKAGSQGGASKDIDLFMARYHANYHEMRMRAKGYQVRRLVDPNAPEIIKLVGTKG